MRGRVLWQASKRSIKSLAPFTPFKIARIESRRSESFAVTRASKANALLQDSVHPFFFFCASFIVCGECIFDSAVPQHRHPSIICRHAMSENVLEFSDPPLLFPKICHSLLSSRLFTPRSGPTKVINTSSRCGCLAQRDRFFSRTLLYVCVFLTHDSSAPSTS